MALWPSGLVALLLKQFVSDPCLNLASSYQKAFIHCPLNIKPSQTFHIFRPCDWESYPGWPVLSNQKGMENGRNEPHPIVEVTCPLMVARSLTIGEALTQVGVFAVQVCKGSSGQRMDICRV